jgi:hypothetical protein
LIFLETAAAAGDDALVIPDRSALSPAAAELVEAFRDPTTIRRAILLREVLERPVDRW